MVISTIIRALVLTGHPYRKANLDNSFIVQVAIAKLRQLRLPKRVARFATARNLSHLAVALVTAVVVLAGSGVTATQSSPAQALTADQTLNGATVSADSTAGAYVAAGIAHTLELPVAEAAAQQVEQLNAQAALASASDTLITKPQVVATDTAARREVITHEVKAGDTISSVAKKYGITTDTIRWANDIESWESIAAGQQLTVLPVSGVLHKVASGDSVESLADKYQANAAQITSFNDLEVGGLETGAKVVIPDGVKQSNIFNQFNTGFASYVRSSFFGGHFVESWIGRPYIDNSYSPGYCTYYAAAVTGAPRNWGNANAWAISAAADGYPVKTVPQVGAVAQTAGMSWAGHVAVVMAVNDDGSKIKIRDMNGIAGLWNVGESDWIPTSTYENYIYMR